MYKIIGADKKEYGPVSADQIHRWISEGRVNGQTQVQVAGESDWKPLSQVSEFTETLRVQNEPQTVPPESAKAETTVFSPQEVLARSPELRIGSCLSGAIHLVMRNFSVLFASTFLFWIINTVCSMNGITGLAFWAIHGALYGGLYMVYLKRIREEATTVRGVFSGFGVSFAQLLLAGIISNVLGWIGLVFCVLPGIYLMVAWIFAVPLVADKRLEFWSAMELSRKVVTRTWFPVFALVIVAFLPTLLFNGFMLVKFYSAFFASFQELMSNGKPTSEEIRAVAERAIAANLSLTWIARLVLLVNLPFAIGALMHGYENLFGSRKA